MFNEKDCPYYKQSRSYGECNHSFGECTLAEQYDYCIDCQGNKRDGWNTKLCFVREEYYKHHPETYIQFGKYKYTEYRKIPKDYMAWLLRQDNLNPTLKLCLENVIIENAIREIEENKEDIIQEFIRDNYNTYKYQHYSRPRRPSGGGCPHWLDYDGDVFDAMQGCGINGD